MLQLQNLQKFYFYKSYKIFVMKVLLLLIEILYF